MKNLFKKRATKGEKKYSDPKPPIKWVRDYLEPETMSNARAVIDTACGNIEVIVGGSGTFGKSTFSSNVTFRYIWKYNDEFFVIEKMYYEVIDTAIYGLLSLFEKYIKQRQEVIRSVVTVEKTPLPERVKCDALNVRAKDGLFFLEKDYKGYRNYKEWVEDGIQYVLVERKLVPHRYPSEPYGIEYWLFRSYRDNSWIRTTYFQDLHEENTWDYDKMISGMKKDLKERKI